MFEEITKEFIREHEFIAEEKIDETNEQSFRLMSNDNLPMSDDELQGELRKRFSLVFGKVFKCNYMSVQNKCELNQNTFRKYMSGERDITVYAVAKFCIGAKLTLDETIENFRLCGHILSPDDYLLDAIVVDAIKCKDDIDDFFQSCKDCKLSNKILDKLYRSK